MKKHVTLRVHGRVHGVFFRDGTLKKASDLGLAGFVRNESDGTLYIEAEGEGEQIDELVNWCREGGPPMAQVDSVEVEEDSELRGYDKFNINRA